MASGDFCEHDWPGSGCSDCRREYNWPSPVTAPCAVTTDQPRHTHAIPPCVGHATQDPDELTGDYLEERHEFWPLPRADRYPAPAEAELVTLWKKDRRVVMSITADGKTRDFYMPPARLVYLLREVAEQLAENTLIQ